MVNPSAFQGARKEFLLGEKAAYALAVKDCYVADAMANIQRRYLKRFPIEMDHSFEPTPEQLAAVNDNEADVEPVEPDPNTMTPAEFAAAIKGMESRANKLSFRKAQIKRWLAYQYSKDNHNDGKEEGSNNPYNVMLGQLTGKSLTYPRIRTPANTWRKTQHNEIERQLKVAILVAEQNRRPIPKGKYLAERDRIAREHFEELPADVKEHWRKQATLDHCEVVRRYEEELSEEPSTDPVDRQRAIQGLVQFIQPILSLVCKATGWKATFIAGRPEPAHNGHLNVISVHSGTTSRDIKMNFGRSKRTGYKTQVIPLYANFLQKCYSLEECRARALPHNLGFIPLSTLEAGNESFSIHTVPSPSTVLTPLVATATTAPATLVPITTSGNPQSPHATLNTFSQDANPLDDADNHSDSNTNNNDNSNIFPFKLAPSTTISPPLSPANSRPSSPIPVAQDDSPTMVYAITSSTVHSPNSATVHPTISTTAHLPISATAYAPMLRPMGAPVPPTSLTIPIANIIPIASIVPVANIIPIANVVPVANIDNHRTAHGVSMPLREIQAPKASRK